MHDDPNPARCMCPECCHRRALLPVTARVNPDRCDHPHDALHPGRIDGGTTVCLKCKSVVRIARLHIASGKSPDEQFEEVRERLPTPPLVPDQE